MRILPECFILGNGTCDHENGSCKCQPGFQGFLCNHPCPEGSFGLGCLEMCNCLNGGEVVLFFKDPIRSLTWVNNQFFLPKVLSREWRM